jgi:hypothetical protein
LTGDELAPIAPMRPDASARHIWVNAYVLTVGGLGAPNRNRFASRPFLHCNCGHIM